MTQNWQYANVAQVLESYSEYPDAQKRLIEQYLMLREFLISEGLLLGGRERWTELDIRGFCFYLSDISEEGQQLFLPPINAYFKWLSANDRDNRKPISMRSLQNGLKKIRG